MTIAAAGALVIGAAEEAALVVFLFAVGEVLEGVAADRARASIKALGELVPKTALIEVNGETQQVAASALSIGQTVLVRPGDRISADGDIIDGVSGIDEAPVTGESVPKTKGVGDPVFAGSINTEAALKVKVTKAAEDNTIARIIRLVEEAQEARAPTERFIDRFSRIYMPAIVGLALLVMVVPPLFLVGSGAPGSIVRWRSCLSAAPARGDLGPGGDCLLPFRWRAARAADEGRRGHRSGVAHRHGRLRQDGTLTIGRPQVVDVLPLGATERDVLALAAAVETGSSHPLAEAILARAKGDGVTPLVATGARAIPGRGVEAKVGNDTAFVGSPRFAEESGVINAEATAAIERLETEGKTVAAVFKSGAIIGLVALRDQPRDDASQAIAELKVLGVRP